MDQFAHLQKWLHLGSKQSYSNYNNVAAKNNIYYHAKKCQESGNDSITSYTPNSLHYSALCGINSMAYNPQY